MFFDLSKNKITEIAYVLVFLFVATVGTLYVNNRNRIDRIAPMYLERTKVSMQYYWRYKFPGIIPGSRQLASAFAGILPGIITNKNSVGGERSYTGTGQEALSVPVLAYHGVPSEGEGGVVSSDVFVDQMHALKEAGWNTISLAEFYDFVKKGEPVPDRSFLLTFDDGRKDTYYPADPVLKDLGYKGVMFVITGFSLPEKATKESSYYLSREELRAMAASGRWDLESHGAEDHRWYFIDKQGTEGHFLSNKLWLSEQNRLETEDEFRKRISKDLSDSKVTIERVLGDSVSTFAFPFGDYGKDTQNFSRSTQIISEVAPLVYNLAFYQTWHGNGDSFNYPNPNTFMVKRIEPSSRWSGAELVKVFEDGRVKGLPYMATQFGSDWFDTWGSVGYGENLALQAKSDTTGASAFLNGTYLWRDYDFKTHVDWNKGSHISLMARFKDNDNYLSCVFSRGRVAIQKHVGGTFETLTSEAYPVGGVGTYNVPLGVRVKGNNIYCLVGDELTASTPIFSSGAQFQTGGVGVHIWDEKPGVGSIEVRDVRVDPLVEETQV